MCVISSFVLLFSLAVQHSFSLSSMRSLKRWLTQNISRKIQCLLWFVSCAELQDIAFFSWMFFCVHFSSFVSCWIFQSTFILYVFSFQLYIYSNVVVNIIKVTIMAFKIACKKMENLEGKSIDDCDLCVN